MKRLKHNFKKGMAFVLSVAMIAGLVPAMPGGTNTFIGSSRIYHAAGTANRKYTNAKKLKPEKKKYALKKGRSTRIKVTVVKQSKKKKLLPESQGSVLRYASSDKKIATVTQKGTVMAKKKGICYITVAALNGVRTRIKITVK